MKNWNVRKTIIAREDMPEHHRLSQTLSWPHLVALGVGAIVGTGILTLTGVGAAKAGPAVILCFAIAGVICACAALAYAEMATMYPASGSAYTYSYIVFGELIAWIIGWSLILEYSLVVSAVAVGWSGYASGFLNSIGMGLPPALIQGPELGGIVNYPGHLHHRGCCRLADLRDARKRHAQRLAGGGKAAGAGVVHRRLPAGVQCRAISRLSCPMAFPRSGPAGAEVGVMAAAAIIFFAFYGFDAIATAAEETKNPDRDLAIGIVGSMILCVLIYMAVAAAAIGALAYTRFANSPEPLALILREIGQGWAAKILGVSAVIALADGHSRLLLRAEPDLLRHGARRVASGEPGAGVVARYAGPDHACSPPSSWRSSPASSRWPTSPRWPMPGRWRRSSRSVRRC